MSWSRNQENNIGFPHSPTIHIFDWNFRTFFYWFLHFHHKWEGENDFRNFYQIFTFCDPFNQKKWILQKCLSLLYRNWKSKVKFVNQPHPKNMSKFEHFLCFWKKFINKSKIPILVSNSAHISLLIILITFYD